MEKDAALLGETLGPYRLLEELGRGGMAAVYKAVQPSMDRMVAIKVLPLLLAMDPTFSERFEREARLIARLEHARILPVYDYGQDKGYSYIVMRYLEGGTLAYRLERGPLSMREVVKVIKQAAEGLDYAHRRGVIHRDIKPSNMMLDASGDVYITDFGIAKMISGSEQLTGSSVIGTPAYMSPEQGLGKPLDARSDVYSLGVTLYKLVTGQLPYSADTPMAIVIRHINDPLPPPRSVRPDLSETVEAVILRAMDKDPERRFPNCGALAAGLEEAAEGVMPWKSSIGAPVALPDRPDPPTAPTELPASDPADPKTFYLNTNDAATKAPEAAPQRSSLLPALLGAGVVIWLIVGTLIFFAMRGQPGEDAPASAGSAAAEAGQAAPSLTTVASPTAAPTQPPVSLPENPLLLENFDDGEASAAFAWVDEPDQWGIDDGALRLEAASGSGLGPDGEGDALYAIYIPRTEIPDVGDEEVVYLRVDVTFTPAEDFQQAGLIVLNAARTPVFTLTRQYCAPGSDADCTGDGIYLQDWRRITQRLETRREGLGRVAAPARDLASTERLTLLMGIGERGIAGFFSLDGGITWERVGGLPVLTGTSIGGAGLVAGTGGSGAPFQVSFDNFVLDAGVPEGIADLVN